MKSSLIHLSLCAALSLTSVPALAEFSVNVGAISAIPSDSSSSLNVIEGVAGLPTDSTGVGVNNNTQLGLTFDYRLSSSWGLQLIAATPFSHDITGTGAIDGLKVGKTKHLPPTLLAQYHFDMTNNKFQPFIGVGLNYTTFFDTKADTQLVNTLGALGVTTASDKVSVKLSDSWGLAAQAGFNYRLNETMGIHFMVSKIQLDTNASVRVNGTPVERVHVDIDPMVAMLGFRWSF